MDKIKFSKNFTLSRENLKDTLVAFRANKSVADVAQEVFHAATLTSSVWASTCTLVPSLALVLISGGSHSVASRTSVLSKTPTSSKTPAALKMVPKDPIIVSESKEDSLEEGIRSPAQSASPP